MKRKLSSIAIFLALVTTTLAATTQNHYINPTPIYQYSSNTKMTEMCFDGNNNLYMTHYNDGKIVIAQNGQISQTKTITGNIKGITYTNNNKYGETLFMSVRHNGNDEIVKMNTSGQINHFASVAYGVTCVGVDTTGNYGGNLYTSASAQDHIYSVNENGLVSMFTSWPNHIDGGGIYGMAFDNSGKFGNKMFVSSSFNATESSYSGIFSIDPDGTVTRFSDIVSSYMIGFDPTGKYFGNDMFVMGRDSYDDSNALWRIHQDGTSEKVMDEISNFAFANDGTLYVSSYDYNLDVVTISQVIPEPTTAAIFASGCLFMNILKRKKRQS